MKTIISENERGLLIKNGRFIKMLNPGKYHTFGSNTIDVCNLKDALPTDQIPVEAFLAGKELEACVTRVDVPDGNLGLHFCNGIFKGILKPGTYLFWSIYDNHTFVMADITVPFVSEDIPVNVFDKLPMSYYMKLEVMSWEKGLLFLDGVFVKTLEPGVYYFWNGAKAITFKKVDMRLCQLDVNGQELLTSDKVTLRINMVCHYKLTDYVKAYTEVEDVMEQLHVYAQLALREYVAQYRLDELMANKEQISDFVLEALQKTSDKLYVSIVDAGIKDIILPGEIRDIMNSVLVAEKQAQANVITRREEVASTRSLLNTAKLMEENQTLYKLKELEYLQKICENVGNITVGSGADLLSQLAALLGNR